MAEHRARAGVEQGGGQVGLGARRGVADGVDGREDAVKVALGDPPADRRVSHPERP